MRLRLAATMVALSLMFQQEVVAEPKLVPIAEAVPALASEPGGFLRIGNEAYFSADDGTHGRELWKTDGTAAGTTMVVDVIPGSASSNSEVIGRVGGSLIFVNHQPTRTLRATDGTAAGTRMLMSVPNEAGWNDTIHATQGETRAFVATLRTFNSPDDLYLTDGTSTGTRLVGRYQDISNLVAFGEKAYFTCVDAVIGTHMWVSDGTPGGTRTFLPQLCNNTTSCTPHTRLGNTLLFRRGSALWATDGTLEGSREVKADASAAFVHPSGSVVFGLDESRLWVTDGTAAGTRLLKDIGSVPSSIVPLGSGIAFIVRKNGAAIPTLWTSNGTTTGTISVAAIGEPPFGSEIIGIIGGTVLVSGGTAATGTELWRVDLASNSAELLRDIDPAQRSDRPRDSSPKPGIAFAHGVVFAATDYQGRELWISDGTANGTTVLANIRPDEPSGRISGVVREAATGEPMEGVLVAICTPTCTDKDSTDGQGRYLLDGIPVGTHMVAADNVTHLGQSQQGIEVKAGFETTGVDFALRVGGFITGTVRMRNGQPRGGAVLRVQHQSSPYSNLVYADHNGVYRSPGLGTGPYLVYTESAFAHGSPYVDQIYPGIECPSGTCDPAAGQTVQVTTGQTTAGIDFSLRGYGKISGTIRDASALAPIEGSLELLNSNGVHVGSASASYWDGGKYQFTDVAPGNYFVKVRGYALSGYTTTLYPSVACSADPCSTAGATPIAVTFDSDVTGIDIAVRQEKARITGILRDRNGAPLRNVHVSLVNAHGVGINNGATSAEGRFSIHSIPPGTYHLQAHDFVYPGVACTTSPCDLTGATAIVLAAGQTVGVEFTIDAETTTVSGRILSARTGQALSNARITLARDRQGTQIASEFARSDGTYSVSALSTAREVFVIASHSDYHQTVYPNVRFDCATCPGTPLPAGTHTGVDIATLSRGTISGIVRRADTSAPLAGFYVGFRSVNGSTLAYTQTDASGRYTWTSGAGSFYAFVSVSEYESVVYPGRPCVGPLLCDPSGGDPIAVADGGQITGIDFALVPRFGQITGRVVDALTGSGIAQTFVGLNGEQSGGVWTDANGYYTVAISSGEHRLYASPPPPYFTQPYGASPCSSRYAPSCNLNGGTRVRVTAAATTSGIDIPLVRFHVNSVTPALGPTAGGTRVVIRGTNFDAHSRVKIGAVLATIVSVNPTELVVLTPPAQAGFAHVTVFAASREEVSATLVHGFRYAASAAPADFNSDLRPDLVWRNYATGQNALWQIDRSAVTGTATLPPVSDRNWRLESTVDFDRDGDADIVWRNYATGQNAVWLMQNGAFANVASLPSVSSPDWKIAGFVDMDADGWPDVVWRNVATGANAVWILVDGQFLTAISLPAVTDPSWQLAAVADMTADGHPDFIWRNRVSGAAAIWVFDRTTLVDSRGLPHNPDGQWIIAGAGDVDGDGHTDLVWRNATSGANAVWLMTHNTLRDAYLLPAVYDRNWEIAGPR